MYFCYTNIQNYVMNKSKYNGLRDLSLLTVKGTKMNLPNFKNSPYLLKAIYQINTPMFTAGANTQEAELTPTTFKGVMRFWWRALNWSQIRLAYRNDTEALKELHKQESKLFGVAAKTERKGQGQGACLVNSLTLQSQKKWMYQNKKDGLNYLMGQGLFCFRDGLSREAFSGGQEFFIELTVDQHAHQAVIDVLKIIGLLGGFGSRSRHGLGSVTLSSLEAKQVQKNEYDSISLDISHAVDALNELLRKYDCRKNNDLPPISAFYAGPRIDVINNYKEDAISLLDELGKEQQMYRSYGRNKKVNGKCAEQNFKDDHDLMIQISDRSYHGVPSHPKRVVFGLPHNYFYSSGLKVNVDASTGRRSSPLFFHVHKTNNSYQMISCLLKSKFLPDEASIDFSTNRRSANVDVDWDVITDFMDRAAFTNKETL